VKPGFVKGGAAVYLPLTEPGGTNTIRATVKDLQVKKKEFFATGRTNLKRALGAIFANANEREKS